jgi:septation ring formation regulator EzrA
MVAAFLDMDRRQSVAEAGVAESHELMPERNLLRQWEPIRQTCYRAAEGYLQLAHTEPDQELAPAAAYEQALQQIAHATRTLDEFYENNRAHLEHATALARTAPQFANRVRADAQVALETLQAPEHAGFAQYPSVRTAADGVDAALRALDSAHGTGAVRTGAHRLEEATKVLRQALADAPGRQTEARNTVASVTTRSNAVRTRAAGLRPAFSSLLREFNAASSADLSGNEQQATALLERAEKRLDEARAAVADARPELALDLATDVRAELAAAEELVDAVTDRLATLRSVRENPRAKVDEVRFRLRDAQQLAVQRDLTAEWGSVLDAQLDRIDRAVEALTGVHPDYWAYVRDLDAVSKFIAGVVQRMRGRTNNA